MTRLKRYLANDRGIANSDPIVSAAFFVRRCLREVYFVELYGGGVMAVLAPLDLRGGCIFVMWFFSSGV